jgi:hypothetical protein
MVSGSDRKPALASVFVAGALVLAAAPPLAAQCNPFCFEAANSDLLLTGVPGWQTLPVAHSHGDGTFTVTNGWVGEFATWAANPAAKKLVGDFDGNGWQDVALTGVAGWGSVPIAFSNGNGTFFVRNQPIDQFAYWASLSGVVPLVGDYNGDGLADIALTGHSGWGSVPIAFSMGPEQGFGRFLVYNEPITEFAAWAAMPGATKITGDFNNDGRTDIALTGVAGWQSLPVAFSNGFGGFDVTNQPISGAGIPRFDPPHNFASWASRTGFSGDPVQKIPGDFNGDGRTDIALVGACFLQRAYYNGSPYDGCSIPIAFSNGNGTFTVTSKSDDFSWCWPNQTWCDAQYPFKINSLADAMWSWPPQNYRVVSGDFNGDGRTDLALTGFYLQRMSGPLHGIGVAFSRGDGFFLPVDHMEEETYLDFFQFLWGAVVQLIPGDFNGDGQTDVAILGNTYGVIPIVTWDNVLGWSISQYWDEWSFSIWASNPQAVRFGGDFN